MIKKILLTLVIMFGMFFTTLHHTVNADGWGFSRNDDHTTPDIGKYKDILENTDSYYIGNSEEKEVYLTFDAGYDNGELDGILDTLNMYNVKATFFITGDFVKRFPELTIQMTNEGHVIANHTLNHPDLTKMSADNIKKELTDLEDAYYKLTNRCMSKYVRPPSGLFDRRTLNILKDLGYKTVFWSVAYCDWITNGQKEVDYATKMITDNLHNGAIILLHTVSSSNRKALNKIIECIYDEGYTFKTVLSLNGKE